MTFNKGFVFAAYGLAAIIGIELLHAIPGYAGLAWYVKLLFIAILVGGAQPIADRIIGDR